MIVAPAIFIIVYQAVIRSVQSEEAYENSTSTDVTHNTIFTTTTPSTLSNSTAIIRAKRQWGGYAMGGMGMYGGSCCSSMVVMSNCCSMPVPQPVPVPVPMPMPMPMPMPVPVPVAPPMCCSCCMPVCMPMCMRGGCGFSMSMSYGSSCYGGGYMGRKKRETLVRRNAPALRIAWKQ
ncbi:hypothetical protein WR25_21501 [Diploscapter pachys]|uniref:Uncharacterized protein n=1 Tax=Diploscapter pachys TaxID=2018661 RepID=A0A2A2KD27_9BILA|nr:hypothetical protein WR25_21501 [Diploscapter pachys]